jgi:hypothetical protein
MAHFKWANIALGAAICVIVGAGSANAAVIVPNANASVAGNSDNRFPFLVTGGMTYEQVFAASQFSSLSGPTLLTEMDLRNGIFVNEAFSSTISNIQIALSTVSLAPDGLSANFASNLGANNTQVFNGSLTLSSTNALGPGNTHAFDIDIVFQNPFLYNPAAGNLLLYVNNISGASSAVGADFFDAQNTNGDSISRVYGSEGVSNSTTGTIDSNGLIARFQTASATAVPEPVTVTIFGAGLAGVAAMRRRKARKKA